MKKMLMLSALAMVASVPVAMAEDEGSYGRKGPRGERGQYMGSLIFKHHDLNEDGVVTKDEFLESAEERFDKMDVDGDGEVTKDEAKEHRAGIKEKMQERRKERLGSDEEEGDNKEMEDGVEDEDGGSSED
ncbi:MAG: hypothetical protein ACLFP8_05905 [Alphaproteobacteria bacterium]